MEIDKLVIFGGDAGCLFEECHHRLVVTVHEVDLPAGDTHLGIVLADPFDVAVEGPVAGPQHQFDAAVDGISAQHRQVNLGHHLHQVGLEVHCPALVQYHILDAVAGSKIYVIFVCVIVDAGDEVDPLEVPVVPPVPCYLAGLNPGEVPLGGASQPPYEVVFGQLTVFVHDHKCAPGKRFCLIAFVDIILALCDDALQHVVPALDDGLGVCGKHCLERRVAIDVAQVHAGIVEQVGLGDADLGAALHRDGEKCYAGSIPL